MHGFGGGMVVEVKVCVFISTLSQTIKHHLNHNIKLKSKEKYLNSYIYLLVSFKWEGVW